jgi:branched-chain amino acid transport system substrate-binding protein
MHNLSRRRFMKLTAATVIEGGEVIGSLSTPFEATDFSTALAHAKSVKPGAVILSLYGWNLVHALKAYTRLELAKEQIGVGGMLSGDQIGRPLSYADHAGIWALIWDPKINTDSSKRFIQGVIDKYNHIPTSRCYHGYAAMTQILEAVQRAGTTKTGAVIKALEGHAFDGLKEGRSYSVRRTISMCRMCWLEKLMARSWAWVTTNCWLRSRATRLRTRLISLGVGYREFPL